METIAQRGIPHHSTTLVSLAAVGAIPVRAGDPSQRQGHVTPDHDCDNGALDRSLGKVQEGNGFAVQQRVLLVAPQPFYQDRGTPIAVEHVLRALSEIGYRVDVLTLPGGCDIDIPGVRYFRVSNPLRLRPLPIGFSLRKLWFDVHLFFALRKRLRACRYVAVHAVEEAAFLAALVARRYRAPVLYDMQCSMAEQMAQVPFLRNPLARRLLNACERWLIRHTQLTVGSMGLAERVRAATPRAQVQEWRYPSETPSVSGESVSRLRRELQVAPDQDVVLYSGTFEDYQGLPAFIAAASVVHSKVPDTVFVLVGAEPANRVGVADRLAAALPPTAYRLVDRQSHDALPVYLALATVVVSPRVFGGNLPIKILEYLAAGCAIVATSIPAHRVLLDQHLAELPEPTVQDVAAAVVRLLGDPSRVARLQANARRFAEDHLSWHAFRDSVRAMYRGLVPEYERFPRLVSVIIPARNEAAAIANLVPAVLAQQQDNLDVEVIVVDDGSEDETGMAARRAGARVVSIEDNRGGNPAAARNVGAAAATGDPIVFMDADCTPRAGWLEMLLAAHATGAACVGGSLALPSGLPASARWDYYCGWYHVHPGRPAGTVPNHPPCNLSVTREAFAGTTGFVEQQPIAYAHEELAWQSEMRRAGQVIYFEPRAVVYHWNRPGFGNLLRRNYRWAFSAIESKAEAGVARMAWLYRFPRLLIASSVLLAPIQTAYIIGCWLRIGVVEPLLIFPAILSARFAYAAGMMAGGVDWLKRRGTTLAPARPRWE